MRMMIFVAALLAAGAVSAAEYSLTVYSTAGPGWVAAGRYRALPNQPVDDLGANLPGFAVVRQERRVSFDAGRSVLRFRGVAALIDPATIALTALEGTGDFHVLQRRYRFTPLGTETLLAHYVGRHITVVQGHGDAVTRVSGTLLGTDGALIIERDDGRIVAVSSYSRVTVPALPKGLTTRPTVEFVVAWDEGGERTLRLAYRTGGLTWWANYTALYSGADGCRIDLSAWVSVVNRSGTDFPNTRLQLVAGDVHQAESATARRFYATALASAAESTGFQQQRLFEYHLYTLGRRVDLPDGASKQIALFPVVEHIDCAKHYVYRGGPRMAYARKPITAVSVSTSAPDGVTVRLQFPNTEEAGLGRPLPAGRIRVKRVADGAGVPQFIGSDVLENTPAGGHVSITLGRAFDVRGERTRTAYNLDRDAETLTESFRIILHNHKEQPVTVLVRETLYRWRDWQILEASQAFEKRDANTIQFAVDVPAGESTTLRYTVKYSW